ncbi:thiol:disulfide interchange protein DsbA/DsbL [Gallaecimonas pentaromativorans]|uniref:thiol:disulfide interchange protein DsbA/DsbL n=1 Tax=Gallaecimonas pentaromativorans TaxID=584787 RepID=UPI003A8EE4FD
MKKGLFALFMLLALPLFAADFQAGKDYQVIKGASGTERPELLEFFSFLCPHCYALEGTLDGVRSKLPANIAFEKVHIEALGGSTGKLMARAWAIMETLGVEAKVSPKIFDSVHRFKVRYRDLRDVRAAFVAAGVSGSDFDNAARSFQVESRLNQMRQRVEALQPTAVPDLIVNGKYRINRAAVPQPAQLQALIEYLATKK